MKINLNTMQNQMSFTLFDILNETQFVKVENSPGIQYDANNEVNIRAAITNEKDLNKVLNNFHSFHKELIEKILVSASTLYKKIIVIPNFSELFIELSDALIKRILTNHPIYAPYLNEKEEEYGKGMCEKCVMITYRFVISTPDSDSVVLLGVVVTHEYSLDDNDTSMFTKGKELEYILIKN